MSKLDKVNNTIAIAMGLICGWMCQFWTFENGDDEAHLLLVLWGLEAG